MNTDVLSLLAGRSISSTENIIKQGYSGNNQSTAGCLIEVNNVHSICAGTVIAVERDPATSNWCVTVWVNSQQWVRYCYLSFVDVFVGTEVAPGEYLGHAHNNLLKFEYCTAQKSKFPVRVSSQQLYKHDPTPVLFGQIKLSEVP